MAVYKRGGVWWYGFVFNGQRIQKSTKQSNRRVAAQMEAARKTALAKGEVGIKERKPAPTLGDFAPRFRSAIETRCGQKPRTVSFYKEKLSRLLEFGAFSSARLDEIDEALIERYVEHRRKRVSPATVNRQLATLRRLLRLAYEWKVIDRVPRIQMLAGERVRDFVLSRDQERLYLGIAPQPLNDVALLVLETGLRVGEALGLQWRDIHFKPTGGAKFGYLQVRQGKSHNARRTISLTLRASAMLQRRTLSSEHDWVFPGKSSGPFVGTSLNHQHQKARAALKLPEDFVIHSLRHTMLTRLGEVGVDAFTIMRIAGHSSITVSQRYVHPSSEAMERAFERLERVNGTMDPTKAIANEVATVSTTVLGSSSVSY